MPQQGEPLQLSDLSKNCVFCADLERSDGIVRGAVIEKDASGNFFWWLPPGGNISVHSIDPGEVKVIRFVFNVGIPTTKFLRGLAEHTQSIMVTHSTE